MVHGTFKFDDKELQLGAVTLDDPRRSPVKLVVDFHATSLLPLPFFSELPSPLEMATAITEFTPTSSDEAALKRALHLSSERQLTIHLGHALRSYSNVTYLDEGLRIMRGGHKGLYVLVKIDRNGLGYPADV